MKSKILTFLMSLTIVGSAFATVASAAPNPVQDGLTFTCEYAGLDTDSYHVFNFNLEDTENKLEAVTGSKKYAGNALSQIQFEINFDESIFDTSEIYVTTTTEIVAGMAVPSQDGVSPVKYSWVNDTALTQVSTLPEDYVVSVAVLTNGEYTEEEMLAGISFGSLTTYRVCYYDGSSKAVTYETVYGLTADADYTAKTRIGKATESDPEPVAQSVQTTVFEPAVGDYVEITLTDAEGTQKGDSVKFSLPDNVKGKATKVLGFLKYKIGVAGEGREAPAAGDILTAVLMNLTEGAKATIATETVK